MGFWNSRSNMLTFSRKEKSSHCRSILREEECAHIGSPQREAHPCLGQQVPLPPVLELLFHLLCSDLEVDVSFLCFFCAFLTSFAVASTICWNACQLGCPGYLWKYHFLFMFVLWLQRHTSLDRFTPKLTCTVSNVCFNEFRRHHFLATFISYHNRNPVLGFYLSVSASLRPRAL